MTAGPFTLGQILSAQARLQPEKIGAQDLERAMTYRDWNERACRLANGLLDLGLTKGDRVAVLAYNRVEWAEIYGAAAKAGLMAVPINFRLTGPETLHILEDSGAAALIVEATLTDTIDPLRDTGALAAVHLLHIGPGPAPEGYLDYEAVIAAAAEAEPASQAAPDDPWCLMYTSGTTGRPKGAIRSHRGMATLALMTEIELSLSRRDNALLVMPLCHANSLNFFTAFVYCGGRVTIFSRKSFDAALCLRTFGESGATFTSLVPTQYCMLLEVPEAERETATYDRVEKLMISSAPALPETKRAIMAMFPNSGLFELYGSTEAGWVTMLHPHEQFDKLGTVGREVVGSLPVKLLNDEGEEVPDGEPGELFSCGPYSFDGYWNNPEKTAEACRGAYVSVGDIALRDAEGYIRLIDRKKNVIISGGENIYPSEVEGVLGSHPAVRDVAVVGRPDPKWGETVQAAVVLRAGKTASEAELTAWAKERLAGYKRPREIFFLAVDEMPRNATGKILHRELRTHLAERRQRAVER
ncbi:MAG TPA: AMP-binding protein, partial [Kiloniellaceae bacterium]|nr:AMP-binding protein [Kiloniellaceae bacterium]